MVATAVVLLSPLAYLGGASVSASPSPLSTPDPALTSAQAQARQAQQQLNQDSNLVNRLAESYDLDKIRVAQLSTHLQKVKASVIQDQAKVASSQSLVRQVAVDAFENGSSDMGALNALLAVGQSNYGVRIGFLRSAEGVSQEAVTRWLLAKKTLANEEQVLTSEQHQAVLLADNTHQEALQAQAAANAEQATLDSLTVKVKKLLTLDQQRQAAARQAAAQAQLLRAQQQARQQSASQQAANQGSGSTAVTSLPTTPSSAPGAPGQPSGGSTGAGGSSGGGSGGPSSSAAQTAVQTALAQVGKPYQWGGAGPDSFDCSGLVMYAWAAAGVSLPHYTVYQYEDTSRVSESELEPGDLVFWDIPGEVNPGHVGMYIGGGNVVVADMTGTPVRVESMYFDGTPMGFGRVS